jgi:hypothetical protein
LESLESLAKDEEGGEYESMMTSGWVLVLTAIDLAFLA